MSSRFLKANKKINYNYHYRSCNIINVYNINKRYLMFPEKSVSERFPHLIKYPRGYTPLPDEYKYLEGKIKRQERLTRDEQDAIYGAWGLDTLGLIIFCAMFIGLCVGAAIYPERLRRERLDRQIMENWVSENAEMLEGTVVENLVVKYSKNDGNSKELPNISD
mmetsp:Transcript_48725/g.59936  ORF Transcript_48725/g.59936 Transcript_48725/m.59936 type:complete len:164 (+) Transcript_48725:60-551(+)